MDFQHQPAGNVPVVSPANMLPVQVIRRQVVAPDVVSVQIVLPGARQAPAPYLPGQFVTLALPTPEDTLYRSYSLCGDGDVAHPWELTIKRMEGGAVSTYFYEHVMPGTLLYSSLARGTFTLPAGAGAETPLVMVALGSGITPIMGMLRALNIKPANQQPIVHLHYASRSADVEIFGEELSQMDPEQRWLRQWTYYSVEDQRLTPEAVLARSGSVIKRAHWYMCGPESLKRELGQQLERRGVKSSAIHSEVFGTKSGPAYVVESSAGTGVGGRVTIAQTGDVLDVLPQETLLTALERAGYHPEFSCRAGACGACKLRVMSGQVDPVGEALSASDRAAGYVLSCIARPIGDVTLASGGAAPRGAGRATGAPVGAGGHAGARALVRMGAVVGVSALLLASWNLTNHRPSSWGTASAAGATSGASTTPTPSATGTVPAGAKPTATPAPSQGSGGGNTTPPPPPTAAPSSAGSAPPPPPQPTATPVPPKPTPTCKATPSKPC